MLTYDRPLEKWMQVEANRVEALVKQRDNLVKAHICYSAGLHPNNDEICSKCYQWPSWSSVLNPGLTEAAKTEALNRYDAVKKLLIDIPPEGLHDDDKSPVVIFWGKGGFGCVGVKSNYKEAIEFCHGVKFARYYKVKSISDGWEAIDAVYPRVTSSYACKRLLYVHAPLILTNLDVHYAPSVFKFYPDVVFGYRDSMLNYTAYTLDQTEDKDLQARMLLMTKISRSRQNIYFLVVDHATEVGGINGSPTYHQDYSQLVDHRHMTREMFYDPELSNFNINDVKEIQESATATQKYIADKKSRVTLREETDKSSPYAPGFQLAPEEDDKTQASSITIAYKNAPEVTTTSALDVVCADPSKLDSSAELNVFLNPSPSGMDEKKLLSTSPKCKSTYSDQKQLSTWLSPKKHCPGLPYTHKSGSSHSEPGLLQGGTGKRIKLNPLVTPEKKRNPNRKLI